MIRNLNDEMPPLRVPLFGKLDLFLQDPITKKVVESRHTPNDIVDGGEIWIAELLGGEEYGGTTLTYSAGNLGYGLQYNQVGSDGAATTQGMFGMVSTSGITGNYFQATTNDVASPGNEVVATATYSTSNGNGALKEAGLFSSSALPSTSTDTASRMFNRVNFATINKTDSFQLTLQWTITIGTVA